MEGFKISGSKNVNVRNNPRGQNFPAQISIFLKEEIGYNIPLSQADKLRITYRTLDIDFHDHTRGIMFEKIEKITLGELVLWENHFEKIEFTFPIETLKIMTKIAEKDYRNYILNFNDKKTIIFMLISCSILESLIIYSFIRYEYSDISKIAIVFLILLVSILYLMRRLIVGKFD